MSEQRSSRMPRSWLELRIVVLQRELAQAQENVELWRKSFFPVAKERDTLKEQLAQARALLRELVAAYGREQTDEEFILELYELVEKAKEAGGE